MVKLTEHPDMTLDDVYHGRKTTIQQQQHIILLNALHFTEGVAF